MSAPGNGSSRHDPDLGAAGSRGAVAASKRRGIPVETASGCLAQTEKAFNTRVTLISGEASLDKLLIVSSWRVRVNGLFGIF